MKGLRLIVGTLSIFPVKAVLDVDRETARQAATLAPVVGALLALAVGIPAWFIGPHLPPLLAAALCVCGIAFLTRAIHLDGLADTVDGLGANRDREGTLAVMRRSDIGPFGVVTLALTLMVQVVALAACFEAGLGAPALAIALVLSRAVLTQLCARPPARADGLGAGFAGTTGNAEAAFSVIVAVILTLPIALGAAVGSQEATALFWQIVLQPVALFPVWWLERRSLRRLGGLTGDVYGAAIELAFTASLVVAAVAVSLASAT